MRLRTLLGVVALSCGLCSWALPASPAQANVPIEAAVIDAGDDHTCAIEPSGQALCWGDNFEGQLGDGSNVRSNTAIPVSGLDDAVQISAGRDHTCAVRASGQAVCWGANADGQLGDGSTTRRLTPTPVSNLANAIEISAGNRHTCAIRKSGQGVCWGDRFNGQVGNGTTVFGSPLKTPTAVSDLDDAVQIGAGGDHTCALRETGVAECWGTNFSGEIGQGTATINPFTAPTQVTGFVDAVQIGVGSNHACAIHETGQAICWGSNSNGQLGFGFGPNRGPGIVTPMSDTVWISGGLAHTCAIRESGQARCWGYNVSGQLGDGAIVDQPFPREESVAGLADAWEVAAGGHHSCAVRESGEAVCWGDNLFGQLGDGGSFGSRSPVTVVESPPEPEAPTPAPKPVPIATVPPPPAPKKKPKLSIAKLMPKNLTVQPGAKVTLKVKVKNTGTAAARAVKVCPKVPAKAKSSVTELTCKTVGTLAPKASKIATLSVTMKAKAEGQIAVTIKASSANAGGGSVSVTLKLAR